MQPHDIELVSDIYDEIYDTPTGISRIASATGASYSFVQGVLENAVDHGRAIRLGSRYILTDSGRKMHDRYHSRLVGD